LLDVLKGQLLSMHLQEWEIAADLIKQKAAAPILEEIDHRH
jgi:hypothetical protein